jgi:hypothetical protein
MCEHNSYDMPGRAILKLSFWAVLVSIAFVLMLLTGPFSKLLTPRLPFSGSRTSSSQIQNSGNPSETTSQAPSSSMVWVDTDTGIYHKTSGWESESGRAKRMSESDAIRAGYRSANSEYHRRF